MPIERIAEASAYEACLDAHAIVAVTDASGTILEVNNRFVAQSGYTREELVGQNHRLLNSGVHPPEFWRDMWRTVGRGGVWRAEVCNRAKDGSLYWVDTSIVPFRAGPTGARRYISIRYDVTARHEAQGALVLAKEIAERAARVKSEFLATMSHEIRTPMNGVLGCADLLLDGPLDPGQAELVRTIQTSGRDLLALIDDILDFSKMEAGALRLERTTFDPRQTLDSVTRLLSPKAREKGLQLRVTVASGTPTRVLADPGRVKQLLVNLVGNAIKFTASGHVHVEMGADAGPAPKSALLRVTVTDTGIGIPESAMSTLFQKFTQADSSMTRRFGGTGLGLAICRQLTERMGGAIRVESEEGRGSKFELAIPVEVADAHVPSTVRPAVGIAPLAPQGGELRVLVVEDNPVNRRLATHLLRRLGCAVDVAGNGREAVEMTARQPYALVLMDCHMPEMDGFEATQCIRAREARSGAGRLPIVALTSCVMPEDRARCAASGMDQFVGKPVRPAELEQIILRFGKAVAA